MENTVKQGSTLNFPLPPKKQKNFGYKKWVKFIWLGLGGIILGTAFLFFAVSQGFLGDMPDVNELENPDIYVASEIISSDGVTLGKFEKEKTIPVTYKDLPPHLVYALMAKEDERFREHSGIDLQAFARAVAYGGKRGGGSTISQQLAKLLFTKGASQNKFQRAFQKLKEWSVAVSLEKRYTKEEIITLYFNKFDFLHNANGIELASRIYFNKPTKELTLSEAATFVAMLENPVRNNPIKYPEKAKARRNVVLEQMLKTNYIDQATYDKVVAEPIVVDFHPVESVDEGYSAYYKHYLRKEINNYLEEYEKETGKDVNIYRDGLKIFVTLDSKMQKYAEEAIKEHMTSLQKSFDSEQRRNPNRPFYFLKKKQIDDIMLAAMKRTGRYKQLAAEGVSEDSIMMDFKTPTKTTIFTWEGEKETEMSPYDSIRYHKQIAQAGLMSMEPATGDIKAWVGGIDWKHFQYDHVKQGKRQVGSTFKPFLYATAIEQLGMSPCDSIIDSYFTMPKGKWGIDADWSPKNSDGNYRGTITLQKALANSVNTVSAKLIDRVGPKAVVDMAKELGVTSDIPEQPSIALGAVDITVEQMVGAMSTFANQGVYVKPTFIIKIEDKNGVVIDQPVPVTKDVVNKDVAYAVVKLMEGVTSSGTGARLKYGGGGFIQYDYSLGNPIAGKTGTSQNNSDGWFIGMVPNLATGVWVGNEDRAAHFRATRLGQGATMALPIWGIFMKKCYADSDLDVSKEPFEKPEDLQIKVDCWTPKKVVDTTAVPTDEPNMDEFGL